MLSPAVHTSLLFSVYKLIQSTHFYHPVVCYECLLCAAFSVHCPLGLSPGWRRVFAFCSLPLCAVFCVCCLLVAAFSELCASVLYAVRFCRLHHYTLCLLGSGCHLLATGCFLPASSCFGLRPLPSVQERRDNIKRRTAPIHERRTPGEH
jgi:hypothetical protein